MSLGVVQVVVAIAGALMTYSSQSEAASAQEDAARDAQRLAEMNARNVERENEREAENLSKAHEKEEALNRAKASASGGGGTSFDMVMDEEEATNAQEVAWLKESGKSKADIARFGGQMDYDAGMASASASKSSGWGTLIGGAGDVYGIGYDSGWWG